MIFARLYLRELILPGKAGKIPDMRYADNTVLGILAHVDAGKTTLCEAMLYLSGKLKKQGISGGNL